MTDKNATVSLARLYDDNNTVVDTTGVAAGGGGYLFTTTVGTSTTFPPFTATPDPCETGHLLTEDLIEYTDGEVVGYCAVCNTRIKIQRVPGGVSLVRAKSLLAGLMNLGSGAEIVDESELIGLCSVLTDEMNAEEYALEEVREILDIARKILTKKLERSNEPLRG